MSQIPARASYEPQTTRKEMERKYYYHVWDVMRKPNPIPWLRLGKLYHINEIGLQPVRYDERGIAMERTI